MRKLCETDIFKHFSTFFLFIHPHTRKPLFIQLAPPPAGVGSSTLQPCCAVTVDLVDVRERDSGWVCVKPQRGFSLSTDQPRQQPRSLFGKSQISYSPHTFLPAETKCTAVTLHGKEKGIYFMQSHFEIWFIWGDFFSSSDVSL